MVATPSSRSTRSSKTNPCPVCGRNTDGDCELKPDGLVFCNRGGNFAPPADARHEGDVVPGADGQQWAFLGDSNLGRAMFKPDEGKGKGKTKPKTHLRVVESVAQRLLARLPEGANVPDLNRERAAYIYGPKQETRRAPDGKGGKAIRPWHLKGKQWDCSGGPEPWPLYQQELALQADGWLLEFEGERCVGIAMAAGLVAISQPGHNHTPEAITARYAALVEAGKKVFYVEDNDAEGIKKGARLRECAAAAGLQFLSVNAAEVWPGLPEKGSIDDAPGTAAEQVAALEGALHRARIQARAEKGQEQQQPAKEPPFRILGWGTKLDAIWVQTGQTGVVASIPPSKNGLQRIAGLPYWEALYPGKLGTNWDSAISSVCEQAHDLGQVFTPDRIRGRGVWLDNNRVVWHLGNRLEVEGQPVALTQLQETSWTYASLPALDISPDEKPLTDEEGAAVLDLIHSQMQWTNPGDGLLIAGNIVLGNVCGALDLRPGLQLTGPSQAGKSTAERSIIRPLQGGLGVRPSGATEAGIRQRMQSDALPVVIDESEGEAARQREGHLKLLRLSFDGQEQIRGTAGGQALTYTMRSSITLIGINAAVPNLADRNRLVVVRPRKMPPEQWANFMRQRDALITVKTGQRLIRRSVTNLKALLANISTFQAVVASTGLADRSAEVYGSLLAGAHHMASTAVLQPQQALAWLDSVGWSGLDEETKDAIASDAEGRACLDHLLGHPVHWKESETGSVDVRELLTMVRCSANSDDAKKALGRLGLKFDIALGLVVSNGTRIFNGTKWANGAHRDRLLEIEGADRVSAAVWFTGGGAHKAVFVQVKHLALTEEET
jgi:hypothetical protein